jgi:hypothetical protein
MDRLHFIYRIGVLCPNQHHQGRYLDQIVLITHISAITYAISHLLRQSEHVYNCKYRCYFLSNKTHWRSAPLHSSTSKWWLLYHYMATYIGHDCWHPYKTTSLHSLPSSSWFSWPSYPIISFPLYFLFLFYLSLPVFIPTSVLVGVCWNPFLLPGPRLLIITWLYQQYIYFSTRLSFPQLSPLSWHWGMHSDYLRYRLYLTITYIVLSLIV